MGICYYPLMMLRRLPLAVGLCAGIPTLAYLGFGGLGFWPQGMFLWVSVHRAFVAITWVTMAAVAGDGALEMLRDRTPLHVLRSAVYVLAAGVPLLGWLGIARSIFLPGVLYGFIFVAFALLSAVELFRLHNRELFLTILAQWGVLLFLFAAWALQATSWV